MNRQMELPFPPEYIEIPLSKRGKYAGKYVAIVDAIDADLAKLNWIVNVRPKQKVLYASYRDKHHGTKDRIHRVIMKRILGHPIPDGFHVDHINGDGLDNRRANLRLATRSQNGANQRTLNTNKSGYKGVHWRKIEKKWRAQIGVNQKIIHLGLFEDPAEAYTAYCEAAVKYYGEFARFE